MYKGITGFVQTFATRSRAPAIRGGHLASSRLFSGTSVGMMTRTMVRSNEAVQNLVEPKMRSQVLKGRSNETIVLWKLYATFHRHNTLLSLVAVVEDLDFMEKNSHLSYNDKVLYYLQLPHHTKIHVSAGELGFRKAQRAEYEAGYQVSTRMFKLIEERNLFRPNDKVELILRDFGKGRDAFLAALQGKEGSKVKPHIVRISDDTSLRFGGCRPKKLRRL